MSSRIAGPSSRTRRFAKFFTASSLIFIAFFGHTEQSDARPITEHEINQFLMSDLTATVFDFDDTILHLPHFDVVFLRGDTRPLLERKVFPISSEELAHFGHLIGKPDGPFAHLEMIGDDVDPINGSFRFARPGKHSGQNYFADLMIPVTTTKTGHPKARVDKEHRAPFFETYMKRSSKFATWKWTFINTARGHTESEFQQGLWHLQKTAEAQQMHYRPTPPYRVAQIGGTGPSAVRKPILLLPVLEEAIEEGLQGFSFLDDSLGNVKAVIRAIVKKYPSAPPIDIRIVHVRKHEPSQVVVLNDYYRALRAGETLSIEEFMDRELPSPHVSSSEGAVIQRMLTGLACRAAFF